MPGLGARLGRGGATTTQQSLADSDCIVIQGSNMAENHPVGFRFVVQARERGATVVAGQRMLLYQGVLAQRLWTGREPNVAAMDRALG